MSNLTATDRTSGSSIQTVSTSTELNFKLSGLEDCIIFSKSGKVRGWILKFIGIDKVSTRINFHFTFQRTGKITSQITDQRDTGEKVTERTIKTYTEWITSREQYHNKQWHHDSWVTNGLIKFWSNMLGHDHEHQKQTIQSRCWRETPTLGPTNLAQLLVFMLILLRQYTKICPSLRTTERWESSATKRAEGRESGHSPMARMELPQVSCACREETCFSSKAWTSW